MLAVVVEVAVKRLLRAALVVVVWLWLVAEAIVVVVMVAWLALWLRWLLCGWSKITIGKEKRYLKGSQPGEHEEFPLNNGGGI